MRRNPKQKKSLRNEKFVSVVNVCEFQHASMVHTDSNGNHSFNFIRFYNNVEAFDYVNKRGTDEKKCRKKTPLFN